MGGVYLLAITLLWRDDFYFEIFLDALQVLLEDFLCLLVSDEVEGSLVLAVADRRVSPLLDQNMADDSSLVVGSDVQRSPALDISDIHEPSAVE